MNKRLTLTIGIVGAALIGSVAFASNQLPIIEPGSGTVIQPAGLVAPSNKPVSQEPAAQAPQDAPETPEAIETPTAPSSEQPAVTEPAAAPAGQETPFTPQAPVTVLRVDGAGAKTLVNPGDTFTCIYYFSDGTSVSRPTLYTPVLSSAWAAICPEWE